MRRRFINSYFGSVDDINNYLTVEALEDGLSISFTRDCYYAIDGGAWRFLIADKETPAINIGQTISFKGASTIGYGEGAGCFYIGKHCNLLGNCLSMLFGDNAKNKYDISGYDNCLSGMFSDCPICEVGANFLPATTLADECYYGMFSGCRNLVKAPELPATTLASNCYGGMFRNCVNLTASPELPATTLADLCYENMFINCRNLTTAPELPATTLADYCYAYMFSDCTSLTTAPELPATTLADYCYAYMFYGCKKLNYIKMLATDISATGCLFDWVNGVASTGTFVKHPDMTSLPTGASGIPSRWTVVNDGEESGGGSSLTFPVTLVEGDNGEIGKLVFEYCKENPNKELPNGGIILTAEYGNTVYTLNLIRSAYMTSGDVVSFTGTYNGIYWFINLDSDGILSAYQD